MLPDGSEVYLGVKLTHILVESGVSGVVPAGTRIGHLCLQSEVSSCDIQAGVSTHLAFELEFFHTGTYAPLNLANSEQLSGLNAAEIEWETLAFLAIPYCVFDEWRGSQVEPIRETDRLDACSL